MGGLLPAEMKNGEAGDRWQGRYFDGAKDGCWLGTQAVNATYCLGGLQIFSDVPLIGLQSCTEEAEACDRIAIRYARIPAQVASCTATFRDGRFVGPYDGKEVLLDFPAAGRFLVRAGKEILIDPERSADDGEVRSYLLGSALGLLCHQRGILPLHASAIDVADGCAAFVGVSGAGKSTLVAALAQRGHNVICDDVCYLRVGASGNVLAWPGVGRMRLWEDAKLALGYGGPELQREIHGYNKYLVPIHPPPNAKMSRTLRRVYELEVAPGSVSEVIRLGGATALEVVMQNVYRLSLAEPLGYKPAAFLACAAIAREVPVFRFKRPWGFNTLDQATELLENHLRNTF